MRKIRSFEEITKGINFACVNDLALAKFYYGIGLREAYQDSSTLIGIIEDREEKIKELTDGKDKD